LPAESLLDGSWGWGFEGVKVLSRMAPFRHLEVELHKWRWSVEPSPSRSCHTCLYPRMTLASPLELLTSSGLGDSSAPRNEEEGGGGGRGRARRRGRSERLARGPAEVLVLWELSSSRPRLQLINASLLALVSSLCHPQIHLLTGFHMPPSQPLASPSLPTASVARQGTHLSSPQHQQPSEAIALAEALGPASAPR
jgi:hypothetical protein